MVNLVVWNFEEDTELERALVKANIQYQLVLDMGHYGIKSPHLVVDGVPLDFRRSLKWIKERGLAE